MGTHQYKTSGQHEGRFTPPASPNIEAAYATPSQHATVLDIASELALRPRNRGETGYWVDKNGGITLQVQGPRGEAEVPIPADKHAAMAGNAFVHNHPLTQGPPSIRDIELAAKYGWSAVHSIGIIPGPRGPRIAVYSLRPRRGNFNALSYYLPRVGLNAAINDAHTRFYVPVRERTLKETGSATRAELLAHDTLWRAVAKQADLIYTVEYHTIH